MRKGKGVKTFLARWQYRGVSRWLVKAGAVAADIDLGRAAAHLRCVVAGVHAQQPHGHAEGLLQA